jgi:hypothetical protein
MLPGFDFFSFPSSQRKTKLTFPQRTLRLCDEPESACQSKQLANRPGWTYLFVKCLNSRKNGGNHAHL